MIGVVTLRSLLCAVADSLAPWIARRAFRGVGLGLVLLSIGLLRDVLSDRRPGSAIALAFSVLWVGFAYGAILALITKVVSASGTEAPTGSASS